MKEIPFVAVEGKPQRSKFRIKSQELTGSLTQTHRSFNRRNLHTRSRQRSVVAGNKSTPSQDRVSVYRGLTGKACGG